MVVGGCGVAVPRGGPYEADGRLPKGSEGKRGASERAAAEAEAARRGAARSRGVVQRRGAAGRPTRAAAPDTPFLTSIRIFEVQFDK